MVSLNTNSFARAQTDGHLGGFYMGFCYRHLWTIRTFTELGNNSTELKVELVHMLGF